MTMAMIMAGFIHPVDMLTSSDIAPRLFSSFLVFVSILL